MPDVLLLSNSTMPGTPFFSWAKPWVRAFLASRDEFVFIPYAAVTFSFDDYEEKVAGVFGEMGFGLRSVHRYNDPARAIMSAGGIVVGGGNSFALLGRMYENSLLEVVRKRVLDGVPYVGWSAGSNLACPTIMTTNDMPVVQTPSLQALDLVPFQINPHYHELKFEGQGGETRKERLEEFLVMNPSRKVVGLPEGTLLQRNGQSVSLKGNGNAWLYRHGAPPAELTPGQDLRHLLDGHG